MIQDGTTITVIPDKEHVVKEVIYDIETRTAFHDHPGGRDDLAQLGMSIAGTWSEENGFKLWEAPLDLYEYLLAHDRIIGFNIINFDNIIVAHDAGRAREPLDFRTLDLLADLQLRLGHRVSLDQLAKGLGTTKTGNGLLAVEWWKARQALMGIADILSDLDDRQRVVQLADHFYRRLKHYCIADVELTRDVYRFGLENGFVYYCYHGVRHKVAVDWRPSVQGSRDAGGRRSR